MTDSSPKSNVVSLLIKKDRKPAEKKWGKAVVDLGFSIVPSLLFRAQHRLGLSNTHMVVLLQLADFWWDHNRKPFPSKKLLGERMDMHPRNVQKHISELETAGYLQRIARKRPHGGQTTNAYDLSGLVKKLKKLEPEFREVEKENKRRRAAVERPRARRKATPD